jgi:hypothetical protein
MTGLDDLFVLLYLVSRTMLQLILLSNSLSVRPGIYICSVHRLSGR